MPIFKIACYWQVYGRMYVEAKDEETARRIAHDAPNPPGEYVMGSFEIDNDLGDEAIEVIENREDVPGELHREEDYPA